LGLPSVEPGSSAPGAGPSGTTELAAAFRGNKNVTFKPGSGRDMPEVPASLTESDDLRIVALPCHDYEPVKVSDNSSGPFHCLLCGTAFAV